MPVTAANPPVWAEINLTILQKNLAIIRSDLGRAKLLAVVKHDAYGHGAREIAAFLTANGIDYLGVGRVEEGIELRKAGIGAPILVMGYSWADDAAAIVRHQLTPMVCDLDLADALQHFCKVYQSDLKIHIRVDTSRGGLGVLPEQFESLLLKILTRKRLRVEGIFTHLASAYRGEREWIAAEITAFLRCVACATSHDVPIPLVHASSSPGMMRVPEAHYSMVRIGTALLGLPSFRNQPMNGLEPIMQLKTRIQKISRLSGLLTLGYNCRVKQDGVLKVAVLPLGYGDAPFLMHLRDGEVLVKGGRARILAKPGMGNLLIDVTPIPDVAENDEVVIFGAQQGQAVSVAELAEKSAIDTTCCESLCMLGKQVKRLYVEGAQSSANTRMELGI